ncbi:MAG: prolipoprotein diacylglyceryl transferase [Lachnospiraceae bacterium]|nr:prolipoprotein diacylglyceryl transferase [Lachnospiraceae bacterium]
MEPSIIFPNLGITLGYFPTGFKIFGFTINFYGVVIALGIIVAVAIAVAIAKKTNQDPDDYFDIAITLIVCGVIGARIYYIIFSPEEFPTFISMLNIRNGGLAIYGGLIGGIIGIAVCCKIKKIKLLRVLDTCAFVVPLAQAIGRWGNFFNREAFGKYTDRLFAMQIKMSEASGVITDEMREKIVNINGVDYIQVTPTFLYECIWCLLVFVLIMAFRRYQKYDGEVLLWYAGGYGLGRAWIEGLRTDSLYIGHSNIAVSQLLSIALVAAALTLLIINRVRLAKGLWKPEFSVVLPDGAPGTKAFNKAKKDARKAKKEDKWETYEVGKKEEPAQENKEEWVDLEEDDTQEKGE